MKTEKSETDKEKVLRKDPTSAGRNSNDNFNEDQVDDYGIDYSKPDAEEQLEERITDKGDRSADSGDIFIE